MRTQESWTLKISHYIHLPTGGWCGGRPTAREPAGSVPLRRDGELQERTFYAHSYTHCPFSSKKVGAFWFVKNLYTFWLLTRVSMATGIPEAFTKTGMGKSIEEASNAIFPTAIASLIANFALRDASDTRLHAAVRARSYRDFVKLLKTEAPYIDARNESGETALHVAAKLCSSWHSGPTPPSRMKRAAHRLTWPVSTTARDRRTCCGKEVERTPLSNLTGVAEGGRRKNPSGAALLASPATGDKNVVERKIRIVATRISFLWEKQF